MNLRPFAIVAVVAVAIMIGMSAWAWFQVPADAQIPIHWAADGTPNGYASKTFALLFLPALGAGLGALLYVLPRFEPRSQNLARSGSAYVQVCSGVMIVLVVTQLSIVLAAVGRPLPVNLVVGLAVGGLFVVLGNVLGKVRSNFIFGVRTPWTLTSDLAWNRTHRLVGRLFVVLGLAVLDLRPRGRRGDARRDRGRRGRHHRRRVRLLVPRLEGRSRQAVDGSAAGRMNGLDPKVLLLLIPLVLVELGLIVWALYDLTRPGRRVRGDSRLMWGLIILLVSTIGPILYLLVGRLDAGAEPEPSSWPGTGPVAPGADGGAASGATTSGSATAPVIPGWKAAAVATAVPAAPAASDAPPAPVAPVAPPSPAVPEPASDAAAAAGLVGGAPAGPSAISCRALTKRYPNGVLGLDRLDLEVPAGSVFGLLGPNGAGKTTTLRLLVGLAHATSGSATVAGVALERPASPTGSASSTRTPATTAGRPAASCSSSLVAFTTCTVRHSPRGWARRSIGWGLPTRPTAGSGRTRAACASGSGSPRPSWRSHRW